MARLKNKMISSEVQKFRSSEVQKFRSSEDCTDCQRLVNTCRQHKYKNIPARLDKKSGAGEGFLSADEQGIYDIGCTVASCVTEQVVLQPDITKGFQLTEII